VKTVSTGVLALAVALAGQGGAAWFWLVPLGLAMGALGDLCLALKAERLFLAGVGAFGLGHLAYAAGFLLRSGDQGFDGVSRRGSGAGRASCASPLDRAVACPAHGRPAGAGPGLCGADRADGAAAVLLPEAPGRGCCGWGPRCSSCPT
jgi:hypothetical protein